MTLTVYEAISLIRATDHHGPGYRPREAPTMTGKNKILLNAATMRLVVQHWLDTTLFKTPKELEVKSVQIRYDGAAGQGSNGMFEIEIELESVVEQVMNA